MNFKRVSKKLNSYFVLEIVGVFATIYLYNVIETSFYKRVPNTPIFIFDKLGINNVSSFGDIYNTSSFSLAALGSCSFMGLILLPLMIYTFYRFKLSKEFNLKSDPLYQPTRTFILSIAGFIAWYMVLSPYNYFFENAFLFDRFLILGLFIGMFWYLELAHVLFGFSLLFLWQFDIPLGQNSISDKKIVYEMLLLFSSFLILRPLFNLKLKALWLLMLCLIGSNYFIPALGKMTIGPQWYSWVTDNDFGYHYVSSFLGGWNPFGITLERATKVAEWISLNSFYVQSMALGLEVLGIFLLFRRKLTIVLLTSFCFFHLGVFIESGIFFWKWILFNGIIVLLLIKYRQNFESIFITRYMLLGMFLIGFSKIFFSPVELAWWDYPTRPNIFYEATTESGEVRNLSGNQFSPYDQIFVFQRLYYLFEDTAPVYVPDYMNYDDAMRFRELSDHQFHKEMFVHKSYFIEEKRKQTENLLNKFISHFNQRNVFFNSVNSVLKAPEHLWGAKFLENQLSNTERIVSVRVYYDQYKYENLKPRLIEKKLLLEVFR
jgi:hypothetical protein